MSDKIRLTSLSPQAGCAAKLKATELIPILSSLSKFDCPNLEAGFDGAEDALVYNLDEKTSLVSTVDFFPPMVDDPFEFGEVAAANAISDIYAMGARPIYALSLMCFSKKLDKSILKEILEGGISKAREAGIPIAGGHTIDDSGVKYGLAVTGVVERGKMWRNNTLKCGDALVLTKPLGVGIINTAAKFSEASEEAVKKAIDSMKTLNKEAYEVAKNFDIHAATDVTGFGLLGHLMEMVASNGLGVVLSSKDVPYIKEAKEYAEFGLLPQGLYNNREYVQNRVEFDNGVELWLRDILFDPQTSGGLLLSMGENEAHEFVKKLPCSKIIASVVKDDKNSIRVV